MHTYVPRLGTSLASIRISEILYILRYQYYHCFCLNYISYAYPGADAVAVNPDLHRRAVYKMVLVLRFVLISKRRLCVADLDHRFELEQERKVVAC